MNIFTKMRYYILNNDLDSLKIEELSTELCFFLEKENIIILSSSEMDLTMVKTTVKKSLKKKITTDEAYRILFILKKAFKKCNPEDNLDKVFDTYTLEYINILKKNNITIDYKNLILFLNDEYYNTLDDAPKSSKITLDELVNAFA